jgi:hypothetical protein
MKKEEGKTKKEKVIKRDKSVFEILNTIFIASDQLKYE